MGVHRFLGRRRSAYSTRVRGDITAEPIKALLLTAVLAPLGLAGCHPAVDPPSSTSHQLQPSAQGATQTDGPKLQDEYVSAVGRIEAGITVYFRGHPGDKPDAWFTVVEPYVQSQDGAQMLVRYAETGREEYLNRRAIMRSPGAVSGQLVIHRSQTFDQRAK